MVALEGELSGITKLQPFYKFHPQISKNFPSQSWLPYFFVREELLTMYGLVKQLHEIKIAKNFSEAELPTGLEGKKCYFPLKEA